jgi:hypothetical protein
MTPEYRFEEEMKNLLSNFKFIKKVIILIK